MYAVDLAKDASTLTVKRSGVVYHKEEIHQSGGRYNFGIEKNLESTCVKRKEEMYCHRQSGGRSQAFHSRFELDEF